MFKIKDLIKDLTLVLSKHLRHQDSISIPISDSKGSELTTIREPIGKGPKITIDNGSAVDAFLRGQFARHVLDIAMRLDIDNTSGVIGLEGGWGTGKTYVLNSLEPILEELDEIERPILLHFNPWMISGSDALIEAFLLQLAAEISSDGSNGSLHDGAKVAQKLLKYVKVLGVLKHMGSAANFFVPGSGVIVSGIGAAVEFASKAIEPTKEAIDDAAKDPDKPSLLDAKKAVEEQITKLQRRVIVLVDDLDRLPPGEFVAMLQAVKTVANFKNVVFVLAYDPAIAAQAIQTQLHLDNGILYLQKIVQIPLQLPEPPTTKQDEFARERLSSAIDNIELPKLIASDVENVWPIVAALMSTPRDVEKLRTKLQICTPYLAQEINIADLILLEAITLRYPKVIDWIAEHAGSFLQVNSFDKDPSIIGRGLLGNVARPFNSLPEEQVSNLRSGHFAWDSLVSPTENPRELRPMHHAMAFLFTVCAVPEIEIQRSNINRVEKFRYWHQWRCYHDHQRPWRQSDLQSMMIQPEMMLARGFHKSEDSLLKVCSEFSAAGLSDFTQSSALELTNFLVQAREAIGKRVFLDPDRSPLVLESLIIALHLDEVHRVDAIKMAISELPILFSGELLLRTCQIGTEVISTKNPTFLAGTEERDLVVETWCALSTGAFFNPNKDIFDEYCTPYRLLVLLKALGITDVVGLCRNYLAQDPGNAVTLFAGFADERLAGSAKIQIDLELFDIARVMPLLKANNIFFEKFMGLMEYLDDASREREKSFNNQIQK